VSRTVSHYFNNVNAKNEQRLVEDLLVEAIRITGLDIYYIPRTLVKVDPIFGEDPLSRFEKSFKIEAYFDSPQGFEGDKDIISKFGIELRDKANFIVSRRRFTQAVKHDGYSALPNTSMTATPVRPMEGDLIYFPLTNDLFQIQYADHESVFHQLGGLYIWRITVQKYDYSHEQITTGIPDIDRVSDLFDSAASFVETGFDDAFAQDEVADAIANNEVIREQATEVLDFSEDNPFGEPDHN